jgi:hypothetical protein
MVFSISMDVSSIESSEDPAGIPFQFEQIIKPVRMIAYIDRLPDFVRPVKSTNRPSAQFAKYTWPLNPKVNQEHLDRSIFI